MRLVCPNCGAQYEVADDVVPVAGRDVQCSNCGHTWFERPGATEAEDAANAQDVAAEAEQVEQEQIAEPEAEPEPEPEPAPEPEPEPEDDHSDHHESEGHDDHGADEGEARDDSGDDEDATREADDAYAEETSLEDLEGDFPDIEEVENLAPKPRDLDPGVADILREEAEFEQAARQAESDPIETQPDLGLTETSDEDRRSREAQERLARLRGEPDAVATSAAAIAATMAQDEQAPRRELLPDIEEINSTLRPDAGPVSVDDYDDMLPQRSGFRRGFTIMVLLAIVAVAVYIFAPQLGTAVPALEGVLTSYVAWVDGLRLWLDGQVQGLISGSDAAAEAATPEG